jgi:hypothetical protein
MLIVMLLLLAIGLAVAAYYAQSEDTLFAGRSLAAYNIAAARAEYGAQEAMSKVRSGAVVLSQIQFQCNDLPPANPVTDCLQSNNQGLNSGATPTTGTTPTIDLAAGGGLLYQWVIYRPATPAGSPLPLNMYAIRSIGFYGYALGSPNMVSSEIELTFETTDANGSTTSGGGAPPYGQTL